MHLKTKAMTENGENCGIIKKNSKTSIKFNSLIYKLQAL